MAYLEKCKYDKLIQKGKDLFKKWKASPGTMPLGSAWFILKACREDEETAGIAGGLGLDQIATTVTSLHDHTTCEVSCTQATHQEHQQRQVEHAAPADDNDDDYEPFPTDEIMSSRHEDDTIDTSSCSIIAQPREDIPHNSDCGYELQGSSAGSIFDTPKPEWIVHKLVNKGVFSEEQVLALSGRPWETTSGSRRASSVPSIRRITAHWAVRWSQTTESMTDLCRLYKTFHPEVFADLPWGGRGLVANEEAEYKIRVVHGPSLMGKKSAIGEYIHFGIADGILGKSIGTVHWQEHVTQFRRIHLICPELLPQVFIEAMKPRFKDDYESHITANIWSFDNVGSEREPVVVSIHVNIDGVKWFENSKTKGVPILGRIHSISNSKHCIKIPKGKPFVIGLLMQQTGKYNVQEFVHDFIQELKKLTESTEERPFSVKLECMICDAPQQAELKGEYIHLFINIFECIHIDCIYIE